MSDSIGVRRATEADAPAVAELSSELGYTANAETMSARIGAIIRSSSDLLIVAVDSSDRPVAWLQAHAAHIVESGFRVEIVGLIVSAAARRKGVGRALVSHAEEWAKDISAEAVVVRSNEKRLESHLFYPNLGYVRTKTQQVYRKALVRPGAPSPGDCL